MQHSHGGESSLLMDGATACAVSDGRLYANDEKKRTRGKFCRIMEREAFRYLRLAACLMTQMELEQYSYVLLDRHVSLQQNYLDIAMQCQNICPSARPYNASIFRGAEIQSRWKYIVIQRRISSKILF